MCGDGGNFKKCTALSEAMSKGSVAQFLSIVLLFSSLLHTFTVIRRGKEGNKVVIKSKSLKQYL